MRRRTTASRALQLLAAGSATLSCGCADGVGLAWALAVLLGGAVMVSTAVSLVLLRKLASRGAASGGAPAGDGEPRLSVRSAVEHAIEMSPTLLLTIVNGRVEHFNTACEQLSGHTRASVRGRRVEEVLVPESHRETFVKLLAEPLNTGRLAQPIRVPWMTRDGRRRVIEWRHFLYERSPITTALLASGVDITERLESERELVTLRAYINATFHAGPFAIITLDRDGTVIDANSAALQMWGAEVAPERKPPLNLRRELQDEGFNAVLARAFAGDPAEVETRSLPTSEGKDGFFHIHAVPMVKSSGELFGVSIICHDHTAQSLAEQALRESEERYRFLMDNLREMFIVVQDGRFSYVSEGSRKLLGYDPAELHGKSLIGSVSPEHREAVRGVLAAGLREGQTTETAQEFQMLTRDNQRVWVELRPQLATWQGRTAIIGVLTDIMERHRADEKLRFQGAILDQMTDWVSVTDLEGRVTFVSPALERALGYSPEELLGSTIGSLYRRFVTSGPSPDEVREHFHEQDRWQGIYTLRTKDGADTTADLSVSAMRDRTGRAVAYILLCRDVTAQMSLEAQLRQAQKMEAVGQLAGGIAHDFNNILVAIKGYSQLAAAQLDDDHPIRGDLLQVDQAASRAAELTRQLLAFSKRQAATPRAVDLHELTANFGRMLRRMIGEHVALRFEPRAEARTVLIDPNQVELILMNLVVNARDAMPDGGCITIQTRNVVADAEYCRTNTWARPGTYLVLSVSDTGVGMSSEVREKVFEPFFTTKELGQGTGLGLATVYGIVNQNHGFIELQSQPGEGTTFTLYVPTDSQQPTALVEPPPVTASTGTETILLAEDEEPVLRLASRVLSQAGYRVLTARNGREAIHQFEAHEGEVDLLLFDVVMPEVGGKEAYDAIRAKQPEILTLFCSGYSVGDIHTDFVVHEGIHLLVKPYSPAELLGRVRSLLDRRPDGRQTDGERMQQQKDQAPPDEPDEPDESNKPNDINEIDGSEKQPAKAGVPVVKAANAATRRHEEA